MKLACLSCNFIGGYGDRLQKVEVLEHPKNEPGLANLSFYRGLRRPIEHKNEKKHQHKPTVPDTVAILGAKMDSDGV